MATAPSPTVGGRSWDTPGVVFGDFDGIVVVPEERLAATVAAALAKVVGENQSREMLEQGHLLREVYDRYEVL